MSIPVMKPPPKPIGAWVNDQCPLCGSGPDFIRGRPKAGGFPIFEQRKEESPDRQIQSPRPPAAKWDPGCSDGPHHTIYRANPRFLQTTLSWPTVVNRPCPQSCRDRCPEDGIAELQARMAGYPAASGDTACGKSKPASGVSRPGKPVHLGMEKSGKWIVNGLTRVRAQDTPAIPEKIAQGLSAACPKRGSGPSEP